MKFLLDMNLTPRWREEFERRGHVAAHWADVGAFTASDSEIMRWARKTATSCSPTTLTSGRS